MTLWLLFGSAAMAERGEWISGPSNVRFVQMGESLWVEYHGTEQIASFRISSRTRDYIELYDDSRYNGIWVRLYNDTSYAYSTDHPEWGRLYNGGWSSGDGYIVRFERMFVHDDKEGGSGDWRLRADFGGGPFNVVGGSEANSGETITINSAHRTPRRSIVRVNCLVHEFDRNLNPFGGSDEWEFVGRRGKRIYHSGSYSITLENDEGHVTVFFTAVPR